MRRLAVLIGALIVAGFVTAGLFLGLQALTARTERAGPTEGRQQELEMREEPEGSPRVDGRPITPPKPPPVDIPDTAQTPDTPPRIDAEGRARKPDIEIRAEQHPEPEREPIIIDGCGFFARYPRKALEQRLEGSVTLEFTITADGKTTNIRVVESTDPVFEDAAKRIASCWRYRPKIVDGKPVEQRSVRVTLDFRLEDDEDEGG